MSAWAAYYNNRPIFKISGDYLPQSIDEFKTLGLLDSRDMF
jgi:hypothetical protein